MEMTNVKAMQEKMQEVIRDSVKMSVFDLPEDAHKRIKENVIDFLEQLHNKSGIKDFEVVCDESNNTQESIKSLHVIWNDRLNPNIYFQFISINVEEEIDRVLAMNIDELFNEEPSALDRFKSFMKSKLPSFLQSKELVVVEVTPLKEKDPDDKHVC